MKHILSFVAQALPVDFTALVTIYGPQILPSLFLWQQQVRINKKIDRITLALNIRKVMLTDEKD